MIEAPTGADWDNDSRGHCNVMAPTNYPEIQKDEIEALRSIYPDDFVEKVSKIGAWNKASDPAFSITLRTDLDGEERVAITLSASLPPTYPKSLPELSLSFDDAVRERTRAAAQHVIREKTNSLLGSEMIYDLTVALQEVLDGSAMDGNEDIPTLDEERAARERATRKEAQEVEAIKKLEAQRLAEEAALAEENERLQQLLAQEKARSERRNASMSDALQSPSKFIDIPGGLDFERSSARVKDPTGKIVDIRAVFHRTQYRRGPTATLFLVQPWHGSNNISNDPFLCLKEYQVQGDDSSVRRKIQELESKLEIQMRVVAHSSIVKPLNFRIQRSSSEQSKATIWSITVLTEFTPKGSIYDLLNIIETVDPKRAKLWSIQLLEGLHHYHQQGSAHGAVHLANVLLWESEALTTTAKWSDGVYGYATHLAVNQTHLKLPLGWTAPEVLADEERQDPILSTDMWNFGICLIQLAFGLGVLHRYESPAMALGELRLSQSVQFLLSAVFNANAKKRPSAWDLLHFEFLRNDDTFLTRDPGTYQLPNFRNRRESEVPAEVSEYTRKFIEEGRLGRGGFGEVFRARNKVDGQIYAIKKIKAQSRRALDPVLSEVTVLSRLNHPNVVRYFASWIEEDVDVESLDNLDIIASEGNTILSMNSLGLHPILPPSSRGLDFISSNHVVFGNPDGFSSSGESDESDSSQDLESSSPRAGSSNHIGLRPSSSTRTDTSNDRIGNVRPTEGFRTILYIQMEYCKQETLRDLINSGALSNVVECWRLFRQIVQGLEHIHSASIVHRDLKPENVFVDSTGDLRIGDFGLARPGEHRIPGLPRDSTQQTGSFTKDIGTAWYVAPEVRSSGGGRYDEKADIFSLGVIFLEMNAAFATGMERAESLELLAVKDKRLPLALLSPDKATQASLISAMLQYEPTERPSCSEILKNILVQDEDQTFNLVRRELNDPKSKMRSEFIKGLFVVPLKDSDAPAMHVPSTWNHKVKLQDGLAAMSRSLPDLELQTKVKRQLTSIFRRHGANERTNNPAVFPLHPCYTPSDVIRMMSSTGELLQLPYDLILPNAILLARSLSGDRKSFAFGDVYRPDPRKEDPNIFGEVDFDIVGADSSNLAIDEAEIIKTIDEILNAFPNLIHSTMCFHINHSQLLDRILEFCNIHKTKWFTTKQIISKLNTADWTWARVRYELRSPPLILASTSLDELERFDFRDLPQTAILKLRSMLQDTTEVEAAFAHMNTLTTYLSRLNVRRQIYLSPLSSYNEKFYRGHMFFQCLYDRKRRAVFAAGGRYDTLIREHQVLPTREPPLHAVGFQMTWSGLCAGMMSWLNAQKRSKGKRKSHLDTALWAPRRCDVLVDCYDVDLLDNIGLRILSDLWASSISAELANVDGPAASSNVLTKASSLIKEDHKWTVLIKSIDTVKIRNTSRQDETEVRTVDVPQYLRAEIRERDRNEGRHPVASMLRQDSQVERPMKEYEPDVKVVLSLTKSKKTNRKTIVEEAITQAQEWRKCSMEDPVIAIETKDDVFRDLRNTRLEDPDSWKRLVQGAPLSERQYLVLVQDVLKQQSDRDAAFIYNFRTKGILHYPLPHD